MALNEVSNSLIPYRRALARFSEPLLACFRRGLASFFHPYLIHKNMHKLGT